MTLSNQQVRRATLEDVPKLIPLWQEENLPSADLEKSFKEFQVVESAEGELLGALGMQIFGLEGFLHSEVFAHPEQADLLRDMLWARIQILAQNHGLVRMWTYFATPFWHRNGFQAPSPEILARLPEPLAGTRGNWIFIQLKEETAPAASLDKEFAMFKEAEREQTEKIFRQARVMKMIAIILGIAVFLLVLAWVVVFFKTQQRLPKP